MGFSFRQAAAVLPPGLKESANQTLSKIGTADVEEIRLRTGLPLSLVSDGTEIFSCGVPVNENDLRSVLDIASSTSVHRLMEQMRGGYISVKGGHRIGLCGEPVIKSGEICGFRRLTSLAIRIARPVEQIDKDLLVRIQENGVLCSTLILSPPGMGKTTMLRELIRRVSEGEGITCQRVGVADERREIAAVWEGRCQMDVGRCTDVISDCSKGEGMELLLRGMNPQVLAVDEITASRDVAALEMAAGCGVTLLATAHGKDMTDLQRRPLYRQVMGLGVFERIILLQRSGGVRCARVEVVK